MTRITRKLIRETDLFYRGDKIVVQLLPKSVCVWRKGSTHHVYVTYDALYELGLKIATRNQRDVRDFEARRDGKK